MTRNKQGDTVKLGVFVGSPKVNLEAVRLKIIAAILDAGHIPDGMELWAASCRPTLDDIKEHLKLCDVHVVVLGSRYGGILDGYDISFTEWEYLQSKEAKRPVVSFLLNEKALGIALKDSDESEENKAKLLAFREVLKRRSVCKFYDNLAMPEIDSHVLNALSEVIDSKHLKPFAGWVRAESDAAKLASALQGNPFLLKILDRVVGFQTTGDRLEKENAAKKAAAEMFWNAMGNCLYRNKHTNIFVESGSSLAYVSESFENRRSQHKSPYRGYSIETNNALALLELMLFTDGLVQRNPPIAPDPKDPYGAIFTKRCLDAFEQPPVKPRSLYPSEAEAVEEVMSLINRKTEDQIILATASGWDTDHPVPEFRGPHAGSHANMLFKRALFMTGLPIVVFLTRKKLDPNCREAKFKCRTDAHVADHTSFCYPVFGPELQLEDALKDIPVAICIGYQKHVEEVDVKLRTISEQLKAVARKSFECWGFDMDYAEEEFVMGGNLEAGAFMIANKKFRDRFPR